MQCVKQGELSWTVEGRPLYRRLKLLQEAVARLENDRLRLEQHNIQLRATLEQVSFLMREAVLFWLFSCVIIIVLLIIHSIFLHTF